MRFHSALLLLATSLCVNVNAQAQSRFQLNANVQFENQDNEEFRARSELGLAFRAPLGALPDFCFFSSVFAGAANGTADIDTIAGAVVAANEGPLVSWISHLFLDAALGLPIGDVINFDASAAAGFTASIPFTIEEVAANGSVVQTVNLWNLDGGLAGAVDPRWRQNADESDFSSDNDVKVCTFDLVNREDDLEVKFEFAKSATTGGISGTDVIITPNAFEQFVTINNFPFEDAASNVRLNFLVAAADFTADVGLEGMITYTDGNGGSYFALASFAEADGDTVTADVNVEAFVGDFPDVTVDGYLEAAFDGEFSINTFSVLFNAPGAVEISFDPSLGVGQQPVASAASALLLPLHLIAGLVATWSLL